MIMSHSNGKTEGRADHEVSFAGAMTIADFCSWASIGRSLTYRLIAAGDLKAVKVGKRRLIKHADAQAWLNSLSDA